MSTLRSEEEIVVAGRYLRKKIVKLTTCVMAFIPGVLFGILIGKNIAGRDPWISRFDQRQLGCWLCVRRPRKHKFEARLNANYKQPLADLWNAKVRSVQHLVLNLVAERPCTTKHSVDRVRVHFVREAGHVFEQEYLWPQLIQHSQILKQRVGRRVAKGPRLFLPVEAGFRVRRARRTPGEEIKIAFLNASGHQYCIARYTRDFPFDDMRSNGVRPERIAAVGAHFDAHRSIESSLSQAEIETAASRKKADA